MPMHLTASASRSGKVAKVTRTPSIHHSIVRIIANSVYAHSRRSPLIGPSRLFTPSIKLLMQALHYHPAFWSDPTEFKPERWVNDCSALHTASDPGTEMETASAFVPFLDGKRQCAGRFLAELEFVSVLHVRTRPLGSDAPRRA